MFREEEGAHPPPKHQINQNFYFSRFNKSSILPVNYMIIIHKIYPKFFTKLPHKIVIIFMNKLKALI